MRYRSSVLRTRLFLAACVFAVGFLGMVHGADAVTSAYLSEFMAEDPAGLKDDNGDISGWIFVGAQIAHLLAQVGKAPFGQLAVLCPTRSTKLLVTPFDQRIIGPGRFVTVQVFADVTEG